jgi:hypothetical protein
MELKSKFIAFLKNGFHIKIQHKYKLLLTCTCMICIGIFNEIYKNKISIEGKEEKARMKTKKQ